jgi:diguanylate cyclase (GGDEF)-like protein
VYRIGGDEFVVTLQGKGYDTMNEVIAELNRQVEANIKKGSVVISVGYSVLGQGDQQINDVFDRADRMMYERKKALKAMSASRRRA